MQAVTDATIRLLSKIQRRLEDRILGLTVSKDSGKTILSIPTAIAMNQDMLALCRLMKE